MARDIARIALRWLAISALAAYVLWPAPAGTANVLPPVDTGPALEQFDGAASSISQARERWAELARAAEARQAAIQSGIECGLSPEAAAAVWTTERKYSLPEGLLLAVIKHESSCDPATLNRNRNGTTDGGIAQINSGTEAWLAQMIGRPDASRHNDLDAIEMAGWYLRWLYDQTGNWTAATTAFNRGLGGYRDYEAAYGTPESPYSRAVVAAWNGGY